MDKPISARLLNANAVANIGDSKQCMRKSVFVEHFLYLEKLYLLTQEYLRLNLPVTDSFRAAEADLDSAFSSDIACHSFKLSDAVNRQLNISFHRGP